MASYRIEKNAQYNSNEIYFESKPAAEVLTALRGLKMRWNPKKGCWYGFAAQNDILAAIGEHDNELGGTISEGYLGATRWDGNKSGKYLHGADLSKAIREDIKRAGIKGVSVRCKSYSGGQTITATVSLPESAFVPEAEFVADYQIKCNQYWLYYYDSFGKVQSIHIDKYFAADAAEQEKIRSAVAMYEYDIETRHECQINHYHLDSYKSFTEETRKLLKKIKSIIESYRYDESNAMVDYFNTNFYFDINTKPAK